MFVKKLLAHIPEHSIYVEVFGGGASLLFAKKPAGIEVYNDIDSGLVNFFRILRDKEKFKIFHEKVSLTPYSREEYNYNKATWELQQDDIERAYRWFVVSRQSFGGRFSESWGFAITAGNNMAGTTSKWLSIIDMLPQLSQRLLRVQIEHRDWRFVLDTYDTPDTFFYLDPPYVHAKRNMTTKYNHELTDNEHKELIDRIQSLRGKVLLSGYDNDLYASLNNGKWYRKDYETACHCVGRVRNSKIQGIGSALKYAPRIETVWMNYANNGSRQLLLAPTSPPCLCRACVDGGNRVVRR